MGYLFGLIISFIGIMGGSGAFLGASLGGLVLCSYSGIKYSEGLKYYISYSYSGSFWFFYFWFFSELFLDLNGIEFYLDLYSTI